MISIRFDPCGVPKEITYSIIDGFKEMNELNNYGETREVQGRGVYR